MRFLPALKTRSTHRAVVRMGCAPSREDLGQKDAVVQTAKIDKQLRQDKKMDEKTIKILLLGESTDHRTLISDS
jgi:hypothetical protein